MQDRFPAVRCRGYGNGLGVKGQFHPKPWRSVTSLDDTSCPGGVDAHGERRLVDSQSARGDFVGSWRRGITDRRGRLELATLRSWPVTRRFFRAYRVRPAPAGIFIGTRPRRPRSLRCESTAAFSTRGSLANRHLPRLPRGFLFAVAPRTLLRRSPQLRQRDARLHAARSVASKPKGLCSLVPDGRGAALYWDRCSRKNGPTAAISCKRQAGRRGTVAML
jgi:hypothetical protein